MCISGSVSKHTKPHQTRMISRIIQISPFTVTLIQRDIRGEHSDWTGLVSKGNRDGILPVGKSDENISRDGRSVGSSTSHKSAAIEICVGVA